jgi:uncharacterized membrane protein
MDSRMSTHHTRTGGRRSFWSLLLVCLCLASGVSTAHAGDYTFVPVAVPFPGAQKTTVTGLTEDGTMIGTYVDAAFRTQGFLWRPGETAQALPLLQPRGISPDGSLLVGFYADQRTNQGFLLWDGTFTTLYGPVPPLSPRTCPPDFPANAAALGITPAGIVVGFYQEANTGVVHHGFRYDPATQQYTIIDFPVAGAVSHGLVAIGATGTLLGFVMDVTGTSHGVLKEGNVVTQLDVPGAAFGTLPQGLTDDGTVVGFALPHGFTYQAGVFTTVTYPGATRTQPFGVRGDGVLYGRFVDATQDAGFVAYPAKVHGAHGLHQAWQSLKPWKD